MATTENKIKIDFNANLAVFKYDTPLPILQDFVYNTVISQRNTISVLYKDQEENVK